MFIDKLNVLMNSIGKITVNEAEAPYLAQVIELSAKKPGMATIEIVGKYDSWYVYIQDGIEIDDANSADAYAAIYAYAYYGAGKYRIGKSIYWLLGQHEYWSARLAKGKNTELLDVVDPWGHIESAENDVEEKIRSDSSLVVYKL